jgi:hypothetical protein
VATDKSVAFGGVIYKLLIQAFPKYMTPDSVYTVFPFNIPSENKVFLGNLGLADKYTYKPPTFVPDPVVVRSYAGVADVLGDPKNFTVTWGEHITELTGKKFMLSGDGPWYTNQRLEVGKAIYGPSHSSEQISEFFEAMTTELLKERGYELGDRCRVDAVREYVPLDPMLALALRLGIIVSATSFRFVSSLKCFRFL